MKRVLGVAASVALLTSWAYGQTLYTGTSNLTDQGLAVNAWGSGMGTETNEAAFEGGSSVRISSRNLFQGATLVYRNPINLSTQFSDKNNLLMFIMNIPNQGAAPVGGAGGRQGGPGAGSGGGMNAPEDDDSRGGSGTQAGVPAAPTSISRVRVLIRTTDGKMSEAYLEVTDAGADQRGWRRIGVPLQAIAGFDKTNKTISAISFSGDFPSVFFLGQINILKDETPIFADVTNAREINVGTNSVVSFGATSASGSTKLIFEWDFNKSDGITADAEGRTIRRRFRVPGTYIVTLTVRDAYGLKAPFSTEMTVTVN